MAFDRITAPFTDQQVDALNSFQARSGVHPFTCPKCRNNEHVGDEFPEVLVLDDHPLVATAEGWECPSYGCDYTQNWAHAFMANTPVA